MEILNTAVATIRSSNGLLFATGIALGMGFEFFKIKFSANGISYYKIFNKMQVQRELNKYEKELHENDSIIIAAASLEKPILDLSDDVVV